MKQILLTFFVRKFLEQKSDGDGRRSERVEIIVDDAIAFVVSCISLLICFFIIILSLCI